MRVACGLAAACIVWLGGQVAHAQSGGFTRPEDAWQNIFKRPPTDSPVPWQRWGVGFGFVSGALRGYDAAALERAGVGTPSTPVGICLVGVVARYVTWEAGLSAAWANDSRPFTQTLTGGIVRESSVSGLAAWAQAGVQLPLHARVSRESFIAFSPSASFGYRGLMLKREIGECVDCRVEKIPLGAGSYLSPAMRVAWLGTNAGPSRTLSFAFGLKAAYDVYVTGDAGSGFSGVAFFEVAANAPHD